MGNDQRVVLGPQVIGRPRFFHPTVTVGAPPPPVKDPDPPPPKDPPKGRVIRRVDTVLRAYGIVRLVEWISSKLFRRSQADVKPV